MTRRIPIIPTIVVVAAAAVMVALGFWQLGRKDEKEALIARYGAASGEPMLDPIPFAAEVDAFLFRRAALDCLDPTGWNAIAGRNASGQSGYVHVFACRNGDWLRAYDDNGRRADVVVGWSRAPERPVWTGGEVSGVIAPGGEQGWRLLADEPAPGLEPLARPDPADLPNNHLAYAGQWFFFALTALVIYWLAVRRRWRDQA